MMRVVDRLGTFDDILLLAEGHRAVLEAIRALIAELHPDAFEIASRREKSIWWGWGSGRMKEGYAYAMPHRTHVNLGFFQGARLPDSENLLTGTGKALRHVKLCSAADVAHPAVRQLIIAARDERKAALGYG